LLAALRGLGDAPARESIRNHGDAKAAEPSACRFDPRTIGGATDQSAVFTIKPMESPTVSVAFLENGIGRIVPGPNGAFPGSCR
jgi:hypothetical protein